MIINYFTLWALSREFSSFLEGSKIKEIYTQRKNELLITFEELSMNRGENVTLCISVEPRFNYVFFREEVQRARRNSVDLFRQLIGKTFMDIYIHPSDRILLLKLNTEKVLLFQLYDTIASNIILVDSNNRILEAFKNNKTMEETKFDFESIHQEEFIPDDTDRLLNEILNRKNINVFTALKQVIPRLGSIYAREALYCTNITETTIVQDIEEKKLKVLVEIIQDIFNKTTHPFPVIYLPEKKEPVFSIIQLKHLENCKQEVFDSVNNAVKSYALKLFRKTNMTDEKDKMLQRITSELKRLWRASELSTEYRSSEPEQYERLGKLLLANLHLIRKGMKEIEIGSENSDGIPLKIMLDQALTPVKNAERYFEKAKKIKDAREKASLRYQQLCKQIDVLKKLEEEIKRCGNINEVELFKKENIAKLQSIGITQNKSDNELPPFRIFTLAAGFEVWVGKSSANNDLLTMKYTKPNDLWFHIRGASGSHTILKVRSDMKTIPKEAIRQAASIAAYYSKMRKAGTVPVAYCERKYVRKYKGASPGSVILEREEVVFVKPQLP